MEYSVYGLKDGTFVRRGDRIRVITEGTVTDIGGDHIDYQAGDSEAACVYPEDGEFVSLEILRPEVKIGQVWQTATSSWFIRKGFSSTMAIPAVAMPGIEALFLDEFTRAFPEAKLVFDPDNA